MGGWNSTLQALKNVEGEKIERKILKIYYFGGVVVGLAQNPFELLYTSP